MLNNLITWLKTGKSRRQLQAEREAEHEAKVQAIRKDIYKQIDQATKATHKLNKLLDDRDDVAYKIFLATGGDKRK